MLITVFLCSCNLVEAWMGHQFSIVINDNDTSCISEINKKKYEDGIYKAAKENTNK